MRDGKRQEVHRTKIVPGDMIFLSNGMEIPADCILYRAVNVIVNESAITGETNEVYKNTLDKCVEQRMDPNGPTPLLISGSNIVSGEGIMMAAVVGKDSKAGKNFELIFSKDDDDEADATPLERQLEKLASQIGRIGISAAIFIFIVLLARLLIE